MTAQQHDIETAAQAVIALAARYGLTLAHREHSPFSEAVYLTFRAAPGMVIRRGRWRREWGNPPGTITNPGFVVRVAAHRGPGGKSSPQFHYRLDQGTTLADLQERLRAIRIEPPQQGKDFF